MAVHETCADIAGFPDDLALPHRTPGRVAPRQPGVRIPCRTDDWSKPSSCRWLMTSTPRFTRCDTHAASDASDGEFTGYQPRLGRVLWKGARGSAPVTG